MAKIDEIITSNGGQIAHSTDALYTALDKDKHQRTVLVLPSEWTSLTKGSIPEVPPETWLVTEWWLERCIKQKIVLDPNHDVLSQPHLRLPIDGTVQPWCCMLLPANSNRLQRHVNSNVWHGP